MRVLFATGREVEYPRNDVLLRAFRRFGEVELVVERRRGSILLRSLRVFLRSLPILRQGSFDLVFVGFYGHLLMLPFGRISPKPILFDAFLSTYDTLVEDRRRFRPGSYGGRLAYWLDRVSCDRAARVLIDTPQNRRYFIDNFGVAGEKIWSIPVGCNEDVFSPKPRDPAASTRVLFYSSYLPLHGADTVIRAARLLLSERSIEFQMIGDGQEYLRVRSLADSLGVDNVTFGPPISLADLADRITSAEICLGGPFGLSAKAGRVVPGKIYQILAMGRPLIAGDTEANRGLLRHLETAYFCEPGNAEALADSIRRLHLDAGLREGIARSGRELFESACSEAAITSDLEDIARSLTG